MARIHADLRLPLAWDLQSKHGAGSLCDETVLLSTVLRDLCGESLHKFRVMPDACDIRPRLISWSQCGGNALRVTAGVLRGGFGGGSFKQREVDSVHGDGQAVSSADL